jgi:hypothetical protein
MGIAHRSLHESALFWMAAAGVFVVIGGVLVGVGIAVRDPNANLWLSPWFDVGMAAVLLGLGTFGWSLVLFLAHGEADREFRQAMQAAISASSYAEPVAVGTQPVQTSKVIATPPPSPAREFCKLSPRELIRLYAKGGTQLQSQTLIEPYMRQWLQVLEMVESVIPQNNVVTSVSGKDADAVTVTFFFDPSRWRAQLLSVMVGDTITAVGQIHLVTGTQVILNECELV